MLVNGGQTGDRPYAQRQKVPGDFDAISSQGRIPAHSLEHLGTLDRGVVMFRRMLREGIRDVNAGKDPHGLFRDASVIPTYASDRVVPMPHVAGDESDALMQLAEQTAREYLANPPLQGRRIPKAPPVPGRRYTFRDSTSTTSGTQQKEH